MVCRGLLYGAQAGPQESPQRRRLLELLAQACKPLSLQRNVVVKPDGHQVPLFTSIDAQGLLGADGRFYILDVFRTFPADANFCPEAETENQIVSREEDSNAKHEEDKNDCTNDGWPENYHSQYGLPAVFVHKLCRLKPQLLQAFIQHKSAPHEIIPIKPTSFESCFFFFTVFCLLPFPDIASSIIVSESCWKRMEGLKNAQ